LKSPILTYIQNWQVSSATKLFSGPAILLAFFFASCEEPIEVESDLVPGGNNTEIRYVEIPLEMNHTSFDSLLVSTNSVQGSRGQIFVGHQNSPEIGGFSAEAYFGLTLNEEDFVRDSLTASAEIFETKLKLDFNYYYGSSFDQQQKFIVRQITDSLKVDVDYTIYDELATDDVISIDNSVLVTPNDTLPDIVPLSNSFGEKVLDLLRNDTLSSAELYYKLKGLRIETSGNTENLQAINLSPGKSYLEVLYRKPSLDTVESVTFNLSGSSFTNVKYNPGSLIPSDYSGKKSFALNDPSKAYFNNLVGISPRLDLKGYLNFIDTVQFMQINKAELVVGSDDFVLTNSEASQIRPAGNIVPYILEEDGTIAKQGEDFWALQSNFNSSGSPANPNQATSPVLLSYDEDKKEIKGDISFFLQEIYNNPDLWEEQYDFMFTGQFIRRNSTPFNEVPKINIANFDNFLVDKENIKLKIYYTTFK